MEASIWYFGYFCIHIIFGKQPKYHIEASNSQFLQNIANCYCIHQEDLIYYYGIGYSKGLIYESIAYCGRSSMAFLLIQHKNKNMWTILAQMPCFANHDLLHICILNFFIGKNTILSQLLQINPKKILLMLLEDEIGKP